MKEREDEKKGLLSASVIRGIVGPGLNSSLGIFFPAVAAALGVGIGSLSLTVSVASLAGMLYMSAAGRLFLKLGARKACLIGVCLTCISFALMGFGNSVVWWFLLALPFGMGTVILVNLLGPLLAGETGTRVGGVLGYMMALSGVAAMVLQPVITTLTARVGWRVAYLMGGAVTALVLLLCLFWIPKEACRKVKSVGEGESPLAIRMSLFFFLAVIAAFNAFHQHMATCADALQYTNGQVGTVLFLSMAGATVGGVIIGHISHRFGALTGGICTLLVGAASVTLYLFGAAQYSWFCLASILHGVASAAIGITAQAVARERCGESYAHVLTFVLRAVPLATVVAMPLYGMVFDMTGSYRIAWWGLLILLCAAGGVLLLAFRRKKQQAGI